MINKWIFLVFLLGFSSLSAVCDIDHPLTLIELVDTALDNNPLTRKAWWNARRAAAALGTAKSAYYPTAHIRAKAVEGQDFLFINGPNNNFYSVGGEVTLGWMLYDSGSRDAAYEATRMALLASNWQADSILQKVIVRVLENAYATLYAQEVVQAAVISVIEAERLLDSAKKLNQVGLTAITDVYTSQAAFSSLKMELAQERARLDIHRGKLAASIGLPADCYLELAPIENRPIPTCQDLDALMDLAYSCRTDLFAKQARLCESFARYRQKCSGYGPRIAAFGSAGATKMLNDKTSSGQHRIGVTLDYPLFDGFQTFYETRTAFADTQLSAEEMAELELEIALEVLTHSRGVQAAQEMLPEAEDNLSNAQKAYEGVLDKYKAGKERIAEVSNAHRSLVAARVRYSDVKTKLFVSIANLAFATGTLTPPMEKTCTKEQ